MPFWKVLPKVVLLIMVVILLGIAGVHLYLYSTSKTFILQLPYTQFIIRLGKVSQSTHPKEIDASFQKVVVNNNRVLREPLYEDNMIVDQWDDGTLYAHDIRTGEKRQYNWIDETAYVCVDTRRLLLVSDTETYIATDPKETLANYKFNFWDDGVRGDQGSSGFFHFDSDVEPGLPVKLILVNRTLNENGGYWLLNIILFVNKDCADFEV